MKIDKILEKLDISNMYHEYFKRKDEEISLIFTTYYEIVDRINNSKIEKSFNLDIVDKFFLTCSGISYTYIINLLNNAGPNGILLVPCKSPCDQLDDFYGFLIADYDKEKSTISLLLICDNGSFLITLLILIAYYLNVKYISLDSVADKNVQDFYKKYGFRESNSKRKKDLVPMILDMSLYSKKNLSLIKKRQLPKMENYLK